MAGSGYSTARRPSSRHPFMLRAKLSARGLLHETGVDPDLVFGLELAGAERRNFMVEIDRGTMPITRSRFDQTSFEKKMRTALDWKLDILFSKNIVQFLTERAEPVSHSTAMKRANALEPHSCMPTATSNRSAHTA